MQITITRKAIVVGDRHVVSVKDGQVDKTHKRGGENSFYIQPLFDSLTAEVSKHKQMAALRKQTSDGVVTIVADLAQPGESNDTRRAGFVLPMWALPGCSRKKLDVPGGNIDAVGRGAGVAGGWRSTAAVAASPQGRARPPAALEAVPVR